MTGRFGLIGVLFFLGAAWGISMPLAKIAVGSGGNAFGLVVWELAFSIIILGAITAVRRKPLSPRVRHLQLYVFIAIVGSLIPTTMWFYNAAHLPAGILSIVISLVPMFSLPIAVMMGLEKFKWIRLTGIVFGALAIVVLFGPKTSLPDPSKAGFVLLALIGPLCYGIEGNGIAKMGLRGLDPIQASLGASIVGLVLAVPMALYFDQLFSLVKPWGPPEWALLASSILTTLAYAGYLWLVGRAGPVFSAQVSYLVTGSGVFWSIVLLSESYSGWVWLSLGLMLTGMFLVQPKSKHDLENEAHSGKTAPEN